VVALIQCRPWTKNLIEAHARLLDIVFCDELRIMLDHLIVNALLHLIHPLQLDRSVIGQKGHQKPCLTTLEGVYLLNHGMSP
jgi:hypothetical protein